MVVHRFGAVIRVLNKFAVSPGVLGGGQSFIDSAARFGVDAFITGEVSEQTIHSAREQGLHFYAAGHHATERGGIQALSDWLNSETDLEVTFIDIPNPA